MSIIHNPDRRTIALLSLRARLKLEIKVPPFATSNTGRFTMKAAKGWGFTGRTRKQALAWVNEELASMGHAQ